MIAMADQHCSKAIYRLGFKILHALLSTKIKVGIGKLAEVPNLARSAESTDVLFGKSKPIHAMNTRELVADNLQLAQTRIRTAMCQCYP